MKMTSGFRARPAGFIILAFLSLAFYFPYAILLIPLLLILFLPFAGDLSFEVSAVWPDAPVRLHFGPRAPPF